VAVCTFRALSEDRDANVGVLADSLAHERERSLRSGWARADFEKCAFSQGANLSIRASRWPVRYGWLSL